MKREALLVLLRQFFAMTDHDRQFHFASLRRSPWTPSSSWTPSTPSPPVGHSTTGEAGGTLAVSQNCRKVVADPTPDKRLLPVRSGRYGHDGYSGVTIW